jgi:hypothetical protein
MKRLLSYLAATLVVVSILASPMSALAATAPAPSTPTNSSSGLSITPRRNLNVRPGGGVTDKLTIGNLNGSQDLNITLRVIDFSFLNESGTPKLMLADNAPQTTWSLRPFATLPKSILVPAGKSRTFNYSINIPKNQGAGSYYSAIQYVATGANGGNVSLSASGVTLVFVSVPGTVTEQMDLKKLGAYQSGDGGKFVYIATTKPQQIGFSLKNSGNVAESPVGTITLKGMFGSKTKTIEDLNPNSNLALIGQTRLFTACIETKTEKVQFNGTATSLNKCKAPSLIPGRYTVKLNAFYGQNGNPTHEITKTAHFWYLPFWFLAAVLAVILLIAYAVWKIKRKLNRATSGSGFRRGVQPRRR